METKVVPVHVNKGNGTEKPLTDTQSTSWWERSPLPKRFNLRVPQGGRTLGKNETAPFPPRQPCILGFAYPTIQRD